MVGSMEPMNIQGHQLQVTLPYFTVDLGTHTQALADARLALEELRLEERRVKHLREVTEQARIEMNSRMNRPGQNVYRMA